MWCGRRAWRRHEVCPPAAGRIRTSGRTCPLGRPGPVADPRTATLPGAISEASEATSEAVVLPAKAVRAVRALVGAEHTAAFIAAAAQREVQARTMDALASSGQGTTKTEDAPDA